MVARALYEYGTYHQDSDKASLRNDMYANRVGLRHNHYDNRTPLFLFFIARDAGYEKSDLPYIAESIEGWEDWSKGLDKRRLSPKLLFAHTEDGVRQGDILVNAKQNRAGLILAAKKGLLSWHVYMYNYRGSRLVRKWYRVKKGDKFIRMTMH